MKRVPFPAPLETSTVPPEDARSRVTESYAEAALDFGPR